MNYHIFMLGLSCTLLLSCQSYGPLFKDKKDEMRDFEINKLKALEHYQLGKEALKNKESDTAILQFSQCLLYHPENQDCIWELGHSYFLGHQFGTSLRQWQILKKINPKYPNLGLALDKAIKHLELKNHAQNLKTKAVASFNPRKKTSQKKIIIHAMGDTMLGTDYPRPMLSSTDKSILSEISEFLEGADINFLNYEGTLCSVKNSRKCEEAKESCYAFRSPPKFTEYLQEAGINLVSLANNHIYDFEEEGRSQTEENLSKAGILWSGRSHTVARFEKNGIPISFLAFHSATHTNSTLDIKTAQQLIKKEKKKKRVVIVSFHGGAEGLMSIHTPKSAEFYVNENRGDVRLFAHKVIDSGADLVLGHGPHVLRGMEFYKGKLIAYSLGNFATYKTFGLWGMNSIGMILEIELNQKGQFLAGRIIPTKQIEFGIPVFDSDMSAIDLVRYLSQSDFKNSAVEVAQDGSLGTKKELIRKLASLKEKKQKLGQD